MKKYIIILFVFFCTAGLNSFTPSVNKEINWLSTAEFSKAYAVSPKPILIDLYTDWCGWCKQMDKTTFRHGKLVDYVNEKFYAIKFNAESKEPVSFNGKTYNYNPQWKVHEFAVYLSHQKLEFPQTIFMTAPSAVPTPLIGYMKARDMEMPIKYFGEQATELQSFAEFAKKNKKEWK